MLSTWERNAGATPQSWQQRAAERTRSNDPLSDFLANVDRMIYVTSVALAGCVALILIT